MKTISKIIEIEYCHGEDFELCQLHKLKIIARSGGRYTRGVEVLI